MIRSYEIDDSSLRRSPMGGLFFRIYINGLKDDKHSVGVQLDNPSIVGSGHPTKNDDLTNLTAVTREPGWV